VLKAEICYMEKPQLRTAAFQRARKEGHPPLLLAFSASFDLTKRPFTRFLVSALSFRDSYRMCFSYLQGAPEMQAERIRTMSDI
jgi:hypothetical protein